MKLRLVVLGKTNKKELQDLIADYEGRIRHYIPFETVVIPDIKKSRNSSPEEVRNLEGKAILDGVKSSDIVFLFDEKGKTYSSRGFAGLLQKQMNAGHKQLVLVVGGAYGFSKEVYDRAQGKISLSEMTFSHQMVRLFIVEQVYRACTILKGEPYHHD
ncbi:MAG: 23S rRNA (pseudouridine(1915)-N(3))-methyltransferase RlmH [Flavobacteriaceae bacterium]|nr:23S rRNA (pseudouridine(1915)-N(3))-methyltransferase RlmH [Flavobacteriaceae bacterium]MDH3796911.1 23S rRNA (pseudouridine(1915)-N(3))-methyltransferase RlmH [Flavobacteriaceae bacterium]